MLHAWAFFCCGFGFFAQNLAPWVEERLGNQGQWMGICLKDHSPSTNRLFLLSLSFSLVVIPKEPFDVVTHLFLDLSVRKAKLLGCVVVQDGLALLELLPLLGVLV